VENETLIEKINEDLKLLRKLKNEKPMFQIYEFYTGTELIMVGTLRQIARYTMYTCSTLKNYSYPSYLKKTENSEMAPRLIKISEQL